MKVSETSVSAIARLVTGDAGLSKYRSGPDLVDLFNRYGSNDVHGQGFPSRWAYAEKKIRALNESAALAQLVRELLHPREFIGLDVRPTAACEYLNERLKFDGYEITLPPSCIAQRVIRTTEGSRVQFISAALQRRALAENSSMSKSLV
jgi:hypothetical protein